LPEDVPRLVALLERGRPPGAEGPSPEDPSDLARYTGALDEMRSRGSGDVLVAELDGEVVGMCQVIVFRHFQRRGGLCAEVESMHVRPDLRGRGLGERLVTAAVALAREAGCYRIQLTSDTRRVDAHRFYRRLGFEPSHVGFKRLIDPID
jgi:GNAT superfamily N-acetyltransferase